MKKVTISIIGAGSRGLDAYAGFALKQPDLCEIVAVAEPREAYRNMAAKRFNIPSDKLFHNWEEFVSQPRQSDAVIIATQDRMHTAPALACIDLGYDILLEKPMAPTPEECKQIVHAALRKKCIFAVGHVLRYTTYFSKLREIIQSGVIGDISGIRHIEGIANWHYAHSYVRGNWGNSEKSSSALLAKCCHDIDILYYLTGRKCLKVGSFGGRKYFCKANQPANATERCLDCPLKDKCIYSASSFYLKKLQEKNYNWPLNVVVDEFTEEAVIEALRNGPYGRCVYACDNNVMEQQALILEFEDKISATMTMTAFSSNRRTEIYGTQGEIHSNFDKIRIRKFGATEEASDAQIATLDISKMSEDITSGHGGGDFGLAKDFVLAVQTRDPGKLSSGPEVTLESHLATFAAEESRLTGNIIEL
jgi:predicted dehydrogenase